MTLLANRILRVAVGFALVLPILGLAHELLVIISAKSVMALANNELIYQIARQFINSPVHARISLEMLGGVEPKGIAVAGFPGQWLYAFAPIVFLDPNSFTTSAPVSAVLSKGSTVLGFFTTQVLVEFAGLVLGALAVQAGSRRQSPEGWWWDAAIPDVLLTLVGLLLIAEGIWSAFGLTVSPDWAKLDETGIGVAFSLFFQIDSQRYYWLMHQGLPLLIPTFLTTAAIGIAWLIGQAVQRIHSHFTKAECSPSRSIARRMTANAMIAVGLIPGLALAAVTPSKYGIAKTALIDPPFPAPLNVEEFTSEPLSPLATIVETSVGEPTTIPTATPLVIPAAMPLPVPTQIPTATLPIPSIPIVLAVATPETNPSPAATATVSPTPIKQRLVKLRRPGSRFILVVNDRPTYVRGLNYNVNYTAQPDELKRQLHRRDFGIMRAAGANAVIGWGVYDQATLDVAREYDIGVFMPFELNPDLPFENKNYREQIKNEFRKYVLAYKDSTAVWGWNPGGDELLHRMETELHRTPDKLQSASDLLLELATLAYSIDPNHVSIIKEPRDVYVTYIEDSVRRERAQNPEVDPSQYYIFGVNTYGKTESVALVLDTTRQILEERVGIALVVGEFAPFGLARNERPAQYVEIWKSVRANSSLGGFAYVFGPDQPNPQSPNAYDPLRLLVSEFSLVDNEGNPVDGSLAALAHWWTAIGKHK